MVDTHVGMSLLNLGAPPRTKTKQLILDETKDIMQHASGSRDLCLHEEWSERCLLCFHKSQIQTASVQFHNRTSDGGTAPGIGRPAAAGWLWRLRVLAMGMWRATETRDAGRMELMMLGAGLL